jgi:4-hydroxybenzoate polyprenyltransferase
MAFQLIPFPISIIFAIVFVFVCIAILWKLHKKEKIYSILFKASLIVGILLFIALIFSIAQNMLNDLA